MLLTSDEIELRLLELQKVRIDLDGDPVASGLASINKKIAELQGWKDRVSALLIEAIKNKTEAQLLSESKKFEYDQQQNVLFATDPEVQNQKNEKSRTAVASTKMAEQVLQTHYAEKDLLAADAYYKCVQQVYMNLEGANSNLSRQISVVQMSLQVGELNREVVGDLFGKTMRVKQS